MRFLFGIFIASILHDNDDVLRQIWHLIFKSKKKNAISILLSFIMFIHLCDKNQNINICKNIYTFWILYICCAEWSGGTFNHEPVFLFFFSSSLFVMIWSMLREIVNKIAMNILWVSVVCNDERIAYTQNTTHLLCVTVQ